MNSYSSHLHRLDERQKPSLRQEVWWLKTGATTMTIGHCSVDDTKERGRLPSFSDGGDEGVVSPSIFFFYFLFYFSVELAGGGLNDVHPPSFFCFIVRLVFYFPKMGLVAWWLCFFYWGSKREDETYFILQRWVGVFALNEVAWVRKRGRVVELKGCAEKWFRRENHVGGKPMRKNSV